VNDRDTALLLVLIGVGKNNAWKLAPPAMQGYAWSISESSLIAALLVLIALRRRSWSIWLAVALLAGFELQVLACSIAFLISPWSVIPGDELCSSGLHFPVGSLGLWAALFVAWRLHRKGSQ
jgi:hypothetical protein